MTLVGRHLRQPGVLEQPDAGVDDQLDVHGELAAAVEREDLYRRVVGGHEAHVALLQPGGGIEPDT